MEEISRMFEDLINRAVRNSIEAYFKEHQAEQPEPDARKVEDYALTREELCQRWHISKATLHSWCKAGVIAPVRLGGRKLLFTMPAILKAEANGIMKNKRR